MPLATIRFYGNLNVFLPASRRRKNIPYRLNGPVAVKHPIEALGIPHTEVDLILGNGDSVDFTYQVQPKDRIDVYPPFYDIQVAPRLFLRPSLSSPPGFILDNHLGQLTTYLRLLGFDARYHHDFQDEDLARLSCEEQRVLLTRDRRLLMRKIVDFGYWLRTKEPRQQLAEVLERYELKKYIRPWRRCLRCNGHLRPVPKEEILERLEPKTRKYYHEFHICQRCDQIYWKGSHYEPLRQFVEGVID